MHVSYSLCILKKQDYLGLNIIGLLSYEVSAKVWASNILQEPVQ